MTTRHWVARHRGGLAALALVALLAVLAWRDRPTDPSAWALSDTAEEASSAPVMSSPVASVERRDEAHQAAPAAHFTTLLLPDTGVSAETTSVRLGLAQVSEEARSRHLAWLQSGAEGAGPKDLMELAEVQRWLELPAARLSDGRVRVGPAPLPPAHQYVLEAKADDGLRFYRARFDARTFPGDISPMAASGLRIATALGEIEFKLQLLRRGAESEPALWRAILAQEAPHLNALFDEGGLTVHPGTELLPLPPSTFEAVVWLGAAEVQRQTVVLAPGVLHALQIDSTRVDAARAQSVRLHVDLVEAGTGMPIPDVALTWQGPRGEVSAHSDANGHAALGDALAGHEGWLALEFPQPNRAGLPIWPVRRLVPVAVPAADELAEPRVYRQRIEVQPLRWLVLMGEGRRSGPPVRGQPFPVFSLQRGRGDAWEDLGTDHFIPTDEGLAVSIEAPGRYRVMKAASPWSLAVSGSATFGDDTHVTSRNVSLLTHGLKTVSMQLMDPLGRPLANQVVTVASGQRGLPTAELLTDAHGWLAFPDATDSPVELFVAGAGEARISPLAQRGQAVTVEPAE